MSRTSLILAFFLLYFSHGFAQTVIYQEDFSGYANGATSGSGWGATANPDCDDGGVNNGGNQWGVFGGQFVANDIEGGGCCSSGGGTGGSNRATFTVTVPISGYSCVEASLETGGSGSLECDFPSPTFTCDNSHDQMVVEYQVDGGAWNLIAYICGDQGLGGISVDGLRGNTLRIRVQMGNKANDEFYWIDNILVTGTPSGTPPTIAGPATVCTGGTPITLTVNPGTFTSYQWSNGDSGRSIQIDQPGTYTVTVTNAAGCEIVSQPKVVNAAPPPAVSITGPNSVCVGNSITLSAPTGLASYNWSTGGTGRTISVSDGGTYSVTVTNAAGCSNEASYDVTGNIRPTLDNPGDQEGCGSVFLPVISGIDLSGNEAYYSGSNGSGTRYFEGNEITSTRTIFIFAGVPGCSDQESFQVRVTPIPNIFQINDVTACDSYTLPAVPGTNLTSNRAYYTGPDGTGTRFDPGAVITTSRTLYAYAGTNDCTDQEEFRVTIVPGPRINDLPDQTACASYTLPAITGTNLSGNQAYYTQTNGGGTRLNPGAIITTTQTLYIFDGTPGCSDEETVRITITGGPQINDLPDQTVCNTYTLPAITGTNLSGNQAYYTQTNGGGTRLNPGAIINTSQTLYIYDTDGSCSDEESFTISIADMPAISAATDATSCGFYELPAIAGTNLSGGQAYYTQANGSGTKYNIGDTIFTSISLFMYDGAVGCSDEEVVNINILSPPILDGIPNQTACQSYILPNITGINLSGNQAFYTQPNGGGTRLNAGDIITNNTTLYIFDDNGSCSDEKTFTVIINEPPVINPISAQRGCVFYILPKIAGTNLSGNETYYTLSGGNGARFEPGDTIRNSVSLYAYDNNNNCTTEQAFTITINPLPSATVTTVNASCHGSTNGAIELTVQGAAPFIFDWDVDTLDGQQNATGLPAGTYNVIITDNRSCSTTAQAIINQPEILDINCSQLRAVSGTGLSDGQAQLIISGGTEFYTISWTGPSNGSQILATADTLVLNNLPAGSYQVTLTDFNNCSTTCNFAINVEGCDIMLDLIGTDATCPDATDGAIQATITGGQAPFIYDWNVNTLDGIEDPSGLAPGNYILNVIDNNNCIVTKSIEISPISPAPTALLSSGNIICEDDCFIFDINLTGTAPFTLEFQVDPGTGPLPRTITTNSLNETFQVCAADFGLTNDTITIRLVSIADANCQAPLSQVETIIIKPISRDTIATTLCQNESVIVNGITYNQATPSGTEIINGGSSNGCDSIIVVNLSFEPPVVFDLNQTLCEGESIIVNGTTYNQANPNGTEIFTAASVNGCDSTVNVNLSFYTPIITEINETLCTGESIVVNGIVYDVNTPSGTEIITGGSANGCDSTINVNLSFYPAATFDLNQTLCEGASIMVNGVTYDQNNPTGTEILIGASSNGCDSTVNINLTYLPTPVFDLTQTLCDGESIIINGVTYDQNRPTGTETITGGSVNGCDSIVNINLNFYQPAVFDLNQTLCEGDSIIVNNIIYNQNNPSGTEIIIGASSTGCDSTVNVNLTYIFNSVTNIDSTLCPGESLIINGNTYDANNPSGTEVIPGGSANGCDSIITVNLQFFQPAVFDLNQTLCESESIIVNGIVYDINNPIGTEILTGASVNNCDSIVNINLSFYPPAVFDLNQTLCESDSIIINGVVYDINNPSGTEIITNASVNGCDSIVNINLDFYTAAVFDLTQTLCEGESIIVNNVIYNQTNPSGTEILTGASVNGCDSTININLTYIFPSTRVIDTTLCTGESLIINGAVYNVNNSTGTEIIAGGSANGCDSIVQINLRFAPEIIGSIEGDATICAGESTTLTFQLTGGQSFDVRYSNGSGSTAELTGIVDGHAIQVSPTLNTIYAIELIAVNGSACPAQIGGSARVQVSNLQANAVSVTNFGGFGVSCAGATDGVVIANATNGIATFQYLWNTGTTSQQLSGIGVGNYNVTITDAAGCEASASITINQPQPIVISSSTRDPLCSNQKNGAIIIENITGGAGPYEISTNGTSFRAINAFPYELGNLAAGNYNVFIRDVNDCEVQFNTSVVAISEPKVELGENVTISLGDSLELEGLVNFTPTKIEWTPTDYLSSPDMLRTFVKPEETTIYQLTASDTSGCVATDQIMVFVNKARKIYIPTAFSPDGDGNNDFFYIYGGNDVVRIKQFLVFDRWGNLMYERGEFLPNDPQYGWDGRFNGRDANVGVYVYYAEIEFIDGLTEIFEGDVAIVR